MSDIVIHKGRDIGYTEFGETTESRDVHVKLLSSFRHGALRMLKGSPLSVFLCVALHEADDQPGASLSSIQDETGYDRKTVIGALRFLEDAVHRFIERCGREQDGTNRYRPAAYAWFGSNHGKRSSIPQAEQLERASSIRQRARGMIPSPGENSPSLSGVVLLDSSPGVDLNLEQTDTVRAIFSAICVRGQPVREPALSRLSAVVAPELARAWAEWLPNAPASFTDPVGFMVKTLKKDATAIPPGARQRGLFDGYDEIRILANHGTAEHRAYLREHAELAHLCGCLGEELENADKVT